MAGLWVTDGKGKRAVDAMAWLGGKWRSSEVLLVAGGIELTLSRDRVLGKLDIGAAASVVLLAWLRERKGRRFETKVLRRWGLLNKIGLSESD